MRPPRPREPRPPVRLSLSVAQLRMLGRIIRGAYLTLDRYRVEHATMAALQRKGCIAPLHRTWSATNLGREVHAAHGKLHWAELGAASHRFAERR